MSGPVVRDATVADLDALAALREPLALHRDRLADAAAGGVRSLVLDRDGELAGFCLLVSVWPESWPPIDRPGRLPRIIDLFIGAEFRGEGLGSEFIEGVADAVRGTGGTELWIAVDPEDNPRARALYERLGFVAADEEPFPVHWRFTDSGGNVHEGRHMNVDLVRSL